MKHKSELYCSVPELRQRVFEQWYEEWETPESTSVVTRLRPALKRVAHVRGSISHLFHLSPRRETTTARHSALETEIALQ